MPSRVELRSHRHFAAKLRAGALAVLVVVAGGCKEETKPPAAAEVLERATFTLSGTSFAMPLPKRSSVQRSARGDHVVLIRDFSKSTRLQRMLILALVSGEPDATYERKRTLANGARLEYRMEDNTGGGSGGPIAELVGRMHFGPHVFSVECTDQSEWPREPDWCLIYLGRLETMESGQ